MVTELGLKGNELLIYALIYGFSQTENQWFTGTLKYMAEWTNSTKHGVQKALRSLLDKVFIEKNETDNNGVKQCRYRVYNKVDGGMQQSCIWCATKLHGGMQQSCPNNIDNNNIYNTPYTPYSTTLRMECSPQGELPPTHNEKESGENEEKPKKKNRFIPPTLDEVIAYCQSRGNVVDAKRIYDYYTASDWVDGKGDKVRNWKQKCITWERSVQGGKTNDPAPEAPAVKRFTKEELDKLFGFEMPES